MVCGGTSPSHICTEGSCHYPGSMDTLTMLLAQGVGVYMGFAQVDFALTVRVEVNCRAHTMLVGGGCKYSSCISGKMFI